MDTSTGVGDAFTLFSVWLHIYSDVQVLLFSNNSGRTRQRVLQAFAIVAWKAPSFLVIAHYRLIEIWPNIRGTHVYNIAAAMFMFLFALIVMEGNLMTLITYEGSMTFSDSWENDISRRMGEDAQITCSFSFVTTGLTDPSRGVSPLHSWQKDLRACLRTPQSFQKAYPLDILCSLGNR